IDGPAVTSSDVFGTVACAKVVPKTLASRDRSVRFLAHAALLSHVLALAIHPVITPANSRWPSVRSSWSLRSCGLGNRQRDGARAREFNLVHLPPRFWLVQVVVVLHHAAVAMAQPSPLRPAPNTSSARLKRSRP